jgi:hypothetical protein
MLRALRRSNKYQLYSPWFDPTVDRTHDQSYSRRKIELKTTITHNTVDPSYQTILSAMKKSVLIREVASLEGRG